MGVIEFLQRMLDSEKEYSYPEFIINFGQILHSENIIKDVIEPEIIKNCNDSIDIVRAKIKKFIDFITIMRVFVSQKSSFAGQRLDILIKWFSSLYERAEKEKSILHKEKNILVKILKLQSTDKNIVMKMLHKLKKFEQIYPEKELHKNLSEIELFKKLTQQESADEELQEKCKIIKKLLGEEIRYLNYMKNKDMQNLVKGAIPYQQNLKEQLKLLEEIKNIEESKRLLIFKIIGFIKTNAENLKLYGGVIHLPLSLEVTGKMRGQFSHKLDKIKDQLNDKINELRLKDVPGLNSKLKEALESEIENHLKTIYEVDFYKHQTEDLLKKRITDYRVHEYKGEKIVDFAKSKEEGKTKIPEINFAERTFDFLINSIEHFERRICTKSVAKIKDIRNFAIGRKLLESINLNNNDLIHLIAYATTLSFSLNTENKNIWDNLVGDRQIATTSDFKVNYLFYAYDMFKSADYLASPAKFQNSFERDIEKNTRQVVRKS